MRFVGTDKEGWGPAGVRGGGQVNGETSEENQRAGVGPSEGEPQGCRSGERSGVKCDVRERAVM